MAVERTYRNVTGPTISRFVNGILASNEVLPVAIGYMDSDKHSRRTLGYRDCGGPWLMEEERWVYQTPVISQGTFRGTQCKIVIPAVNPAHPNPTSDLVLWGLGGTAISRTIPTKPVFNAVTALRELRADGVPSMPGMQTWKKRTELARNSGGEYLNVQFGWLPLVSDIKKFCHAVNDSHEILKTLREGSDHTTRVGYHFPDAIQTVTSAVNVNVYHAGNSGQNRSMSAVTLATQVQKKWFNGAFLYHLPASAAQMSKVARYAAEAQALLGVEPTPEAIWNSSPWTWGLDWFANVGDIMTNVSNLGQNGLVLMYGYMMNSCETIHQTYVPPGNWGSGTSNPISEGSVTRTRVWKKRVQASPYGFGVNFGSLSATQKAIIAALGLGLGPRR